jgi:hypothetical protein
LAFDFDHTSEYILVGLAAFVGRAADVTGISWA